MDNVTFDEFKGVYRVTHPNGSFTTYTPEQFRALSPEVVAQETEDDLTEDDLTEDQLEEEINNFSPTQDAPNEPVPTEEPELGKYRLLANLPVTDEKGDFIMDAEKGSIQEVPVMLGEYWVNAGLAEVYTETDNK